MTIENEIFKRYCVNNEKLREYGFSENKTEFSYTRLFMNDEFRANIIISKKGEISGKVYEVENNEEFIPLRVDDYQGVFVGEVREKYKQILVDIRDNCFCKNYFILQQTNRITNAIMSKYGNKPEFMWKKFPGFAVFKNYANNKWYGVIMNIDYSKLGENNKNPVEVINLKLDKNKIQDLIKKDGLYPAWHMNKKFWVTVTLDETLSDEAILKLVDESYSYTVKK